MIDLHNHIINELSANDINWERVIETARLAVGEGVEQIVWTPEFYTINDLQNINLYRANLKQLQEKLNQCGYPLHIALGVDLHMNHIDEVICHRLKEFIDADYAVVSFSPYVSLRNLRQLVATIASRKLVPIIAHPEQYAWIEDDYHILYELIDLGAWLQITSDSLLGMFGKQAELWANRMLDDGIVHVVASESHSLDYKPPLMGEARLKVEKKLGTKEAGNIFHHRAASLLNGQPLCNISVPPGVLDYWESKEIIA